MINKRYWKDEEILPKVVEVIFQKCIEDQNRIGIIVDLCHTIHKAEQIIEKDNFKRCFHVGLIQKCQFSFETTVFSQFTEYINKLQCEIIKEQNKEKQDERKLATLDKDIQYMKDKEKQRMLGTVNEPNNAVVPIPRPIIPALQEGSKFVHENSVVIDALGRHAFIGTIYDQCNDVVMNRSLFTSNVLQHVITDNKPGHGYSLIFHDSLSKKRKELKLGAQLEASCMSGLVGATGKGNYLTSSNSNGKETTASVIGWVSTKIEYIYNPTEDTIVDFIDIDALRSCPPEALVTIGIIYGGNGYCNLKYKHQDGESQQSAEAKVQVELCKFPFLESEIDVGGEGDVLYKENALDSSEKFEFSYHIDALPETVTKNSEEAVNFMMKIPLILKDANDGKGIPVKLLMAPVSIFQSKLKNMQFSTNVIQNIHETFIETLNQIRKCQNKVNEMFCDLEESKCVEETVLFIVQDKLNKLKNAELEVQEFKKQIIDVKKCLENNDILYEFLKNFRSSDLVPEQIQIFCNGFQPLIEKAHYIQWLKKNGVKCIGKDASLKTLHMQENLKDFFEYYCDWSIKESSDDNSKLFKQLIEDGKTLLFIDLQVNPDARHEDIPEGNRICEYSNGQCVDFDYLQQSKEERTMCIARCKGPTKIIAEKPNNRIDLELPCPQSLNGKCEATAVKWSCSKCKKVLQVGLDDKQVYCQCPYGIGSVYDYEFCCCNSQHGNYYTKFDEPYLSSLVEKMKPYKVTNLIAVGKTGNGKSCFINNFANHSMYKTFEEAENGELICPIPCQFKDGDEIFQTGTSDNECFDVGQSSTQNPSCVVINQEKSVTKIFDNPGLGDTRGAYQDKDNIQKTLDCLSTYGEIHGICIFLKSDDSKLDLVFKYIFGALLERLPKSAVNNISFCFTHASNCKRKPFPAYQVLQKYLDQINAGREEKIILSKETAFYFENDSLEYLCLSKNGVEFDENDRLFYKKNWENFGNEMVRLLNHHSNDIKPCKVKEIMSLNEARHIILTATPALVDLTKTTQLNLKEMENLEKKLKDLDMEKVKLLGELKKPHIGIKRTEELNYPRTVCCNSKCTETRQLPNSEARNVHYMQICHENCGLRNVMPEVVPNIDLQGCLAMNGNLTCTKCGCSWDLHLHIRFKQELVEELTDDPDVLLDIQRNNTAKDVKEAALKDCKEKQDQYEKIQKKINESFAVYASFLKNTAIKPYNDTIESYLEFNIKLVKEERPVNEDLIEKLECQLDQYKEEKKILDDRLATGEARNVKPGDIEILQKQLENLPLIGKEFKNLFESNIRGQQLNRVYHEQYFIPYNSSNGRKSKKEKSGKGHGWINTAKSGIQKGLDLVMN